MYHLLGWILPLVHSSELTWTQGTTTSGLKKKITDTACLLISSRSYPFVNRVNWLIKLKSYWNVPNFCSVNTAYRTDASDSFAFKFLDGICTTVIEVDNLCLCVQPSNILQIPRYQDLSQVDGSLPGDLCCGLLWGLGDWKVVLRSKDRGRVGIFSQKNSVAKIDEFKARSPCLASSGIWPCTTEAWPWLRPTGPPSSSSFCS